MEIYKNMKYEKPDDINTLLIIGYDTNNIIK